MFGAALALAPLAARAQAARDSGDALDRAMRDELDRSMKELKLGQFDKPYFLAYTVSEVQALDASATLGSLVDTRQIRMRTLAVELRVGDYTFDNSAGMGAMGAMMAGRMGGSRMSAGANQLPLDDDYLAIRRQIWLATDAAYKGAVQALASRRAQMMNRERTDSLPDMSKETPTRTLDEEPPASADRTRAEALVRELSGVPELARMQSSGVGLVVGTTRDRYVNSEGTSYVRARPLVTLTAAAGTQAPDGTPIANSIEVQARSLDALQRDQLLRRVREMGLQLDSLLAATVADRYTGPVLFQGRAAAELFSNSFAPSLVARRGDANGFTDRIGARVLPEFLSVVDDPTRTSYGGAPLFGAYKVDDDGVPGRTARLVENGILRGLLTTRAPVEGMPHSSGNRRGYSAIPSNLIVEATGGVSDAELKTRLIEAAKKRGLAYGILVRALGGGSGGLDGNFSVGGRGRPVLLAYRVYPDGREELIRGARLSGVTAQSFKDVIAASSTPVVYEARSSSDVISFVVPSLLFDDLALTKPTGERPKPPFIPPPSAP